MSRFSPLFSSSSGNSMYIASSKGAILVDAGMSAKQIELALGRAGSSGEEIKGIFVTHEHSDHVKGVRVLATRYNIPVYGSEGTLCALEDNGTVNGKFPAYAMAPGQVAEVADMQISGFRTSHDCREGMGYIINMPDERKIAVCTDLGIMTDDVLENIKGCDLVVLESNHDIGMLQNGPYPYILKRRILSNHGHLSNIACAEAAKKLVQSGTTRLFLAHLSKENNYPPLAYQTTFVALSEMGAKLGQDYLLQVAEPVCQQAVTVF